MELILSHLQGADIKLKQVAIDHILTKLKGPGIKDLQVNTYDLYNADEIQTIQQQPINRVLMYLISYILLLITRMILLIVLWVV